MTAFPFNSPYDSEFQVPFEFSLSALTMELDRSAGSASSAGLGSLSNELILLILRNFCLYCREAPHERQRANFPATRQQYNEPSWNTLDVSALYAVCLVSKRFVPLAQEILYEFIPGYGASWYSIKYEWVRRLTPFLRTVA